MDAPKRECLMSHYLIELLKNLQGDQQWSQTQVLINKHCSLIINLTAKVSTCLNIGTVSRFFITQGIVAFTDLFSMKSVDFFCCRDMDILSVIMLV